MQPICALTMFNVVPIGCVLHPVIGDDSAPHLRAGEFAIVDTTDPEPTAGRALPGQMGKRPKSIEQLLARR